jgi:hypothetical protein
MDGRRFDLLARDWATSRRRALAVATAAVALRLIGGEEVAAANHQNGALCDRNRDCASNHCCPRRCQTCCTDAHCGPLETCVCSCSCAAISDRALKTDVAPADGQAVLARLAALPIATWRYQWDAPDVRHIGPMAQDFAAAFGVGEDDRSIHAVDGQGVAMAAIQGLYRELEELRGRLAALEGMGGTSPDAGADAS